MTVAEVARLVGVSQRTVERDIVAGRLPARKTTKGRLRILARDARTYRRRNRLRGRYWKPTAYAQTLGVSVNTVRRWITTGRLHPVVVNPRRMFITEADHRRVFKRSVAATAALVRHVNAHADADARHDTTAAPRVRGPFFFTVRELADLAHTTAAAIHRDIRKGAIATVQYGGPTNKIYIRRHVAEAYLGVKLGE